jgi:hypothetical protein
MNNLFIFATLYGLVCSSGIAVADTRAGAIDDSIRPVIAKEMLKSGNSAEWDGSGNGGYLFRHLIDVTGDGRAELFVSSSLASSSNRSEWKVFDVSPTGEMRPYEGSISLMADAVWVAKTGNTTELRCEWPPDFDSDEGLKNRLLPEGEVRHHVSRIGFVYPKIKETKASVTDEEALILKAGSTDAKPILEAMLLADYLTNQNANWQVVPEWLSNSNDYFQLPEDAARINELNSFTPQVAMSLLGATQGDIRATPSPTLPTPEQVRTPKANVASVPKAPEAKPFPTKPSEEPTSSTPWSIIVVLLVAVCGLLWLLLKRRS